MTAPVIGAVPTVATFIGRRRIARPAWERQEVDFRSGSAGTRSSCVPWTTRYPESRYPCVRLPGILQAHKYACSHSQAGIMDFPVQRQDSDLVGEG